MLRLGLDLLVQLLALDRHVRVADAEHGGVDVDLVRNSDSERFRTETEFDRVRWDGPGVQF
jgi:hypothetical protein